jgi:hypothetical protein
MNALSIEMLTPERVVELWPYLEPLFDAACKGNEIAREEMEAKDILDLGKTGLAAIFVCYYDNYPSCALAIQFYEVNGHKGADLIALAGKGKKLVHFKNAYWQSIIEWLKANNVEFLDAYTPQSRALVYQKKFGFNKSCAYVRMSLH